MASPPTPRPRPPSDWPPPPRGGGRGIAADPPAEPHERLAEPVAERALEPEPRALAVADRPEAQLALRDVREPELDVRHVMVLSEGVLVMAGGLDGTGARHRAPPFVVVSRVPAPSPRRPRRGSGR